MYAGNEGNFIQIFILITDWRNFLKGSHMLPLNKMLYWIFNRCRCCSTISLVTDSLIKSAFSSYSLNIRNHKPEELGSWNCERMFIPHNMSYVKCHVSRVTCHMSYLICHMSYVICQVSHVTCQMSHVFFVFLFFFWLTGEAYRWRVCYQWGLPRLVFMHKLCLDLLFCIENIKIRFWANIQIY